LESFLRFTGFINWGTLNKKFDEETKEFVRHLNSDQVIRTIREMFIKHPLLRYSQMEILDRKLIHLRANILMVKEAIEADLTPKQLIALSTFKLKLEHIREMNEIKATLAKPEDSNRALRKYLVGNCYCPFLSAWNYARKRGSFDDQRFIQKIRPDIQKIKEVNVSKEFFYKEAIEMFASLSL
jgi:hypothetical protein